MKKRHNNNLRVYREYHGRSIKDACVYFKVNKSVITRWEGGVQYPRLDKAGLFESFYGAKVQDLWPEVFN